MKTITIRELHEKTGQWVRQANQHGEILVTDHGVAVAKIIPQSKKAELPYFSRRKISTAFQKLSASGKLQRGTDATIAISEDREDRTL